MTDPDAVDRPIGKLRMTPEVATSLERLQSMRLADKVITIQAPRNEETP